MPPSPDVLAVTGVGVVSGAGRGARALANLLSRGGVSPPATRIPGGTLVPGAGRLETALSLAIDESMAGRDAAGPVGLALGTAVGEIDRESADGRSRLSPHALTMDLARKFGLSGPLSTHSSTCASAIYALEDASLHLEAGRAVAMVVAGAEELGRFLESGFAALGALGDPRGLVLGEAAAAIVLEPLEPACSRGARVRAKVAASALASDSRHHTSPDPEGRGMESAIRGALDRAGFAARDVDWISTTAHASRVYGAMYERALGRVFGERCPSVREWESAIGHVLAASGTLGLVHAALLYDSGERGVGLALTVGFGGANGATVVGPPGTVAAERGS